MIKKIILNIALCLSVVASQAQALLPTSWNFSNPSISNPPSGWNVSGLGTNGSLTYAFGTGDAISCRLDATGENFVINIADKPGALSYYLSPQNAGNPWGGQFDIQESDNGTTWSTLRSITSKATTTTNFTGGKYTESNLKSTTRYIRFFYTTKIAGGSATVPGGNMAVDSVLILAAPAPTTPVIQVQRNNVILGNNSQNVVGSTSSTLNFSYKIKNVGTLDTLRIDSVKFSGTYASNFSVSNSFPIKIAPNDTASINCSFTPTGSGSRLASINIYNNDLDKKQFVLNLYAIAGTLATEPSFKPLALNFSNITAWGMTVGLSDTSTSTENYIVLRKRNGAITEMPVDGQTYQKGDYIGAAQVAYVGKVGTFKPTYILANSNYSFKAFAFNGPSSFQNYLTTAATNGNAQSLPGNAGTYYNSINPALPSFITNLSAKINIHDTIFYSNYITTVINNFLTRDTSQGKKIVNCVYTGIAYIYDEPFVWNASGGTGTLTREHTRAQSTMPSNNATQNPDWPRSPDNFELPEYNDQHNLFPAHQTLANAVRSNNPFGECVTVTSTSPTGFGKLGKDSLGATLYEPKDEQKGDLARALFYMSVSYNGVKGNNWKLPANQGLAVLLKWHQQDPPNAEEIARHEYIASIQKNRNPFIDNPSWVNYINFTNMTYIGGVADVTKPIITLLGKNIDTITINSSYLDLGATASDDVDGNISSKIVRTGSVDSSKVGTNTLTYTVSDSAGNIATATRIVLVTSTSNVNEIQSANISVYPSPTNQTLSIEASGFNTLPVTIQITDMFGRNLASKQLNTKLIREELNVSNFKNGIYFITLSNTNGSKSIKFVVNGN